MTQSGFKTTQHEAFAETAASRESKVGAAESPHLANLSGHANLTPDEYLILFGDTPEDAAGESSPPMGPSKPTVAAMQPTVVPDEQPAAEVKHCLLCTSDAADE